MEDADETTRKENELPFLNKHDLNDIAYDENKINELQSILSDVNNCAKSLIKDSQSKLDNYEHIKLDNLENIAAYLKPLNAFVNLHSFEDFQKSICFKISGISINFEKLQQIQSMYGSTLKMCGSTANLLAPLMKLNQNSLYKIPESTKAIISKIYENPKILENIERIQGFSIANQRFFQMLSDTAKLLQMYQARANDLNPFVKQNSNNDDQ